MSVAIGEQELESSMVDPLTDYQHEANIHNDLPKQDSVSSDPFDHGVIENTSDDAIGQDKSGEPTLDEHVQSSNKPKELAAEIDQSAGEHVHVADKKIQPANRNIQLADEQIHHADELGQSADDHAQSVNEHAQLSEEPTQSTDEFALSADEHAQAEDGHAQTEEENAQAKDEHVMAEDEHAQQTDKPTNEINAAVGQPEGEITESDGGQFVLLLLLSSVLFTVVYSEKFHFLQFLISQLHPLLLHYAKGQFVF